MTKEQALKRVASLSSKIETGETSLEAWKWQRAEAMADAADAGATQREVGTAAGMTHQSAAVHIRVWQRYAAKPKRPTYSKAHEEVGGLDRDAAQDRTDRARAKRVLTTPEQAKTVLSELPDEAVEQIRAAAQEEHVSRRLYQGRERPTHEESVRRQRAKLIERMRENPYEGVTYVGSAMGRARAAIRELVQECQDFMAVVEDEEFREMVKEQVTDFRADIDIALSGAIEGSWDDAFARLTKED